MKFEEGQKIRYRNGNDGEVVATSKHSLVTKLWSAAHQDYIFFLHNEEGGSSDPFLSRQYGESPMDIVPRTITLRTNLYQRRNGVVQPKFQILSDETLVDEREWQLVKQTEVTVEL